MRNDIVVEKEGFSLRVTKIEPITEDINSVNYVVKQGTRELTESFIFVMKDDNLEKKLEEVLDAIIRAVKRVTAT